MTNLLVHPFKMPSRYCEYSPSLSSGSGVQKDYYQPRHGKLKRPLGSKIRHRGLTTRSQIRGRPATIRNPIRIQRRRRKRSRSSSISHRPIPIRDRSRFQAGDGNKPDEGVVLVERLATVNVTQGCLSNSCNLSGIGGVWGTIKRAVKF